MRAFLLLALVVAASAVELTPDNFDEMTSGKSVFIKFLAPVSPRPVPYPSHRFVDDRRVGFDRTPCDAILSYPFVEQSGL